MSTNETKVIKGKDLITIGIFSAIYFVINFIFMLCGIIPQLWIFMPPLIALFTGIPFMLMCVKVQKPGAILLLGMITAGIYFATGQFTIVIMITMASACLLAEITRYITGYNTFMGNTVAFTFFSMGMIGSPLPIWLFKEEFLQQISDQGMPDEYVATIEGLSSNGMLVIVVIAVIICSIIGSYVAKKMFTKHFEKAGIV